MGSVRGVRAYWEVCQRSSITPSFTLDLYDSVDDSRSLKIENHLGERKGG